jgi:hypothetical protein
MPVYIVKGVRLNISKEDEKEFLKDNPTAVLETKQDKKESEKKSGQGAAKPKSDVAYDVYNPETIKAAEEKGYTVNKIDPSVQYTGTSVGAQSIWDPESGFYYKEGAPKPGKAGLDYYMKLHEDAIAEYPGGAEKWKKDHLEAANKPDKMGRYGRGDKAIEHVINKVDENYHEATGKRLIDKNKPDWNVPGVQLFNLPGVYKKKEKEPEKGLPELTVKEKETTPAEAQTVNRYNPQAVLGNKRAPWWLQDIIKTSGAAADLARVNKYQPWQDTPQVFLPNATYYDPTRELAANTEQANLASQFHQAFTGPKSGAISGVQGKALDAAANIMAKYNNLNVGLANQLSQERASIMNQASQNQAGLNTQLFDKYTIANQQFDNSKNMARQNLRQSYMDAITNRAKTQVLNTLYPNYYADPSSGGYLAFNPNYTPTATYKSDTNEFDEAVKKYGNVENASKYMDWKYGKTSKKASSEYPYEGYQGNEV